MDASKIPTTCEKCGKKFAVDAAYAGRSVKCPCGNVLKVAAKLSPSKATSAVKTTTTVVSAKTPQVAATPVVDSSFFDQLTAADFARTATNPYSPPTARASNEAAVLRKFVGADAHVNTVAKTANGNITFLAVLNFIGATLCISLGVVVLALTSIVGAVANVLPMAALGALFAGILFVFGTFDLISGIGLIKRTKWGWWLCVIGLSWAFFDRGSQIAILFMKANDWTAEIPKAIGACLFMLASLYFMQFMCQKKTMKLFKLNVHPGVVWGISGGLGLLLGGLSFAVAMFGMQQAA